MCGEVPCWLRWVMDTTPPQSQVHTCHSYLTAFEPGKLLLQHSISTVLNINLDVSELDSHATYKAVYE
jgi:hypothetical protein